MYIINDIIVHREEDGTARNERLGEGQISIGAREEERNYVRRQSRGHHRLNLAMWEREEG